MLKIRIVQNSVHTNYLNMCGQVENSKWILCRRKSDVKDFFYLKT